MKKKIVSLVLVFAMALTLGIGGTVAWLTAKTESVKNTFTVGNINITLDESDDLDFKMVPGNDIEKDPTVTVLKGSEACWLFVKIEESENLDDFITYNVADGWTELTGVEGVTGVYYREVADLTAEDATNADYPVLADNKVSVKSEVTKENLTAEGFTNPTLTFTAYAIQRDGKNFTTAASAWAEVSK